MSLKRYEGETDMAKIAEVIKYEGDNSTFVWKHPSEDFNSLSQLVVHENQEALFMMNGQALDLFGPGRYTLETENIPLIGRLFHLVTGGVSPFHCEVYFINKTEQMSVKWGTDSKVQFLEPVYRFPMEIGACGEMSLKAEDSRRLCLKLVGTEDILDQSRLTRYFRGFLMTRIKSCLARTIREQSLNIFELDEHLDELSGALRELLAPDFAEYGVALEHFFVTTVMRPEGDETYERFKNLHFRQYADVAEARLSQQVDIIKQQTEAQKIIIESQALAQKRLQEGYTYAQERSFDVAGAAAANEGMGQYTNLGVGLATMAGVGNTVGGMFRDALAGAGTTAQGMPPQTGNGQLQGMPREEGGQFQGMQQSGGERVSGMPPQSGNEQPQGDGIICGQCGHIVPQGFKFCPECGAKVQQAPTVCPKCGSDVTGFKFCPECGERL
ncbi:MAG: SPFH domain-containing protein [bacterium]|nr:SPFH domain-containing protein [bacterium]